MRVVGLTGDIAAGKSTVSAMLAAHGAAIIDADRIVRDLQQPGTPVFEEIVSRFGPSVVGGDGALDRDALGAIVFGDTSARRDLEAIVWPATVAEILRRVGEHAETDHVVVLDIPLLRDKKRYPIEMFILVTAPEEERMRRLMADRASTRADAQARIAAQSWLADRAREADVILDNSSTVEALEEQVDALWEKLCTSA